MSHYFKNLLLFFGATHLFRGSNMNIKRYTQIVIASLVMFSDTAFSQIDLVDDPLFLKTGSGANVLLNMSIETPMGGAAYNDAAASVPGCAGRRSDGRGICYFPSFEYVGYFDPKKCYEYSSDIFVPKNSASSDHSCDDGQTGRWSGNFLNWAGMTAIDTYMLTMTGGRRIVDTTSRTVIQRSLGSGFFHNKVLDPANNVAVDTVTPFNTSWAHINRRTDSAFDFQTSSGTTTYQLKVEVCNAAVGLEENCVARTNGSTNYFKPEGLIQRNDRKMRFGVMAYTTDGSHTRQGGVLRNNMKSVGTKLGTGEDNPNKEYADDGLFISNPEGAASGNSGVINYVNKFAIEAGSYKSYDPVSELFYEAIRYFKNKGPTPETYSGLSTSDNGGFPIVTSWEDPIQYACQKNFIVAINDAFPWNDKRLPGTHFNSSPTTDALGRSITHTRDTGEPSDADTDINVTTLTNTVGALEDTESGGEITTKIGTADLGEMLAPSTGANLTPANGDARGNSYYLAGLAYYANTQDLRTESNMPGKQTVATFMIDSQEYNNNPVLGNVNPLWLAGKYGGFVDENGDDTPQASEWDADNDGVPDNYVLANDPKKMVDKLQESFDEIGKVTEASGASVAINSTVLNTNSRLYQAVFDSTDWSGDLKAIALNPDGTVGNTVWKASEELPVHTARNIFTTVLNGSGNPTGEVFTAANVILGGSGSATTTVVEPATGATAIANSECDYQTTGPASKVVDGDTNGNFLVAPGSVNHTCGFTPTDYLEVDLQSIQDISHINLYNRTDGGHQKRLSNALLMVAETPFPADLASSIAHAQYVSQLTGEAIRINVGGPDYTDSRGREWLADTNNPPVTSRNGRRGTNSNPIANANSGAFLGDTTDEIIYQSERIRNNEVNFDIAIPDPNVDQWVILHFSDSTNGTTLIVDIEIDGDTVADDYDLGAIGQNTAQVLVFKRNVGSTLEIDIKGVSGGNPRISAIEVIPEISSNLITSNVGLPGRYIKLQKAGAPFNQDNFLHVAEVEAQVTKTVTTGGASNADIVNYIRGDQSKEQSQTNGIFRNRTSLIGDLVNSTPVTASTENYYYNTLPGLEGSSYPAYFNSKINKFKGSNNKFFNIVYVGSNDGMLHAFQDTYDTNKPSAGREVFAYVPSHLHSKLENLTKPDYSHEYFVNATPHVSDAYINNAWQTMLTGAFGAGAKGLYTLDITNPTSFGKNDVMWEFKTDSDISNGSNEIGYVLGSPQIVRMKNGKWGVVFGNGYNSASQQARLFILDAEDGSIMQVINTGVGSLANPNGLAEPFLIDTDIDGIVDYAYAGDLHGKMWKFDLTDSNASNWDVAFSSSGNPAPLYTALDASGNSQPITSRPTVSYNPQGGFNVLFGTGKYMEIGDNIIPASPAVNSLYSINDRNTAVSSGRSVLVEQQILDEQDIIDDQNNSDPTDDVLINRIRVTSNNQVDYATKKGWFMDLLSLNALGERVIVQPLVRFGRGIFTTYTPSSNPCDGGGVSMLMEIDALTGGRLGGSVYDVNGDGFINAQDLVLFAGNYVVASGIAISGTLGPPAIIAAASGSYEKKIISGTDGQVTTVTESVDPKAIGRQSWRQIQ